MAGLMSIRSLVGFQIIFVLQIEFAFLWHPSTISGTTTDGAETSLREHLSAAHHRELVVYDKPKHAFVEMSRGCPFKLDSMNNKGCRFHIV